MLDLGESHGDEALEPLPWSCGLAVSRPPAAVAYAIRLNRLCAKSSGGVSRKLSYPVPVKSQRVHDGVRMAPGTTRPDQAGRMILERAMKEYPRETRDLLAVLDQWRQKIRASASVWSRTQTPWQPPMD
jgi:hypothetical protein